MSDFHPGKKVTVAFAILKEDRAFPYCGKIGVILEQDCKSSDEYTIDFGSSILCVKKKYVKDIRA